MPRTRATACAVVTGLLTLTGCGGPEKPAAPPAPPARDTIRLSSPAFADGATIPRRYTCDGEGPAPPLRWSGIPAGARGLALVVTDLDAPGGGFVHWVVLALPPSARDLPAGTKPSTLRLGRASSGKVGYEPPCPPKGDTPHRYEFSLYALDRQLPLGEGTSPELVQVEIGKSTIARGVLVGRYGR
jgi:Raf kinase inhibitor-like YbhB/YbcL family protein